MDYLYDTSYYVLRNFIKDKDINYQYLCYNSHDKAIEMISQNNNLLDRYCIEKLCISNINLKAFDIIKNNFDNLTYDGFKHLCIKPNYEIIDLITQHKDTIKKRFNNYEYIIYLCANKNKDILNYVKNNLLDEVKKLTPEDTKILTERYDHNGKLIYYIVNKDTPKMILHDCYKELILNESLSDDSDIIQYINYDFELFTHNKYNIFSKSHNKEVLELVSKNINKLDEYSWINLYTNTSDEAIKIIKSNLDNEIINRDKNFLYFVERLCENSNTNALDLVSKISKELTPEGKLKITSFGINLLCSNLNPKAFNIALQFENYFNISHLESLCSNSNDIVIDWLLSNLNKYINDFNNDCWMNLCSNNNPKVIQIISSNLNKLNNRCWLKLWKNPNIFTYNYELMRDNKKDLHKELNYHHMNIKYLI